MKLKRVSIGLTVGLGIAASQGCMAEPMDESEIGEYENAVCSNDFYPVIASLIVAMADEMKELHPTKYLTKVPNKYGSGMPGLSLSAAGIAKCGSNCVDVDVLLALQDPSLNTTGGIPTAVLQTDVYRSMLVSMFDAQVAYEASRAMNNQCMPGAHTLTRGSPWETATSCGPEYKFDVSFGSGAADITREAESYNVINRNGSQHNWTQSGGSMTIGPDWNYQWPSASGAPNLSYSINFPAAGNYKVWVRGAGSNANNDSVYVGINNTSNNAMVGFPTANNQYGWAAGDISVPSAGTHNVQVFAREDGALVDKIVINQSSTAPTSTGPQCNSGADLIHRVTKFNDQTNLNFHGDATSFAGDPDPIEPPDGSSSGSGSATCPAMPTSGSSPPLIAYNATKDGTCCWSNFAQRTYKRWNTVYLKCTL